MATYCRHPYIQLHAPSSVSLRSGGSILQSKAGPFLASGEAQDGVAVYGRFGRFRVDQLWVRACLSPGDLRYCHQE